MGTNFYWHRNICSHCGHYEKRHIGKSSAGWRFLLRGYEEYEINSLEDWVKVIEGDPTGKIFDEYGDEYSLSDLVDRIKAKADGERHSGLWAISDEYVDIYYGEFS